MNSPGMPGLVDACPLAVPTAKTLLASVGVVGLIDPVVQFVSGMNDVAGRRIRDRQFDGRLAGWRAAGLETARNTIVRFSPPAPASS